MGKTIGYLSISLSVCCPYACMKTFMLWSCQELSSSIPILCRTRWCGRCRSGVNVSKNKVNGSLFSPQGFLSGFADRYWRGTGEDAGSCHLCASSTTAMSRAEPFHPCSWGSPQMSVVIVMQRKRATSALMFYKSCIFHIAQVLRQQKY